LRGCFLVKPLEIGKPQSFEFIEAQLFNLQSTDGAANGFECTTSWPASDSPDLLWSCHLAS
jgi:hypothetical protein